MVGGEVLRPIRLCSRLRREQDDLDAAGRQSARLVGQGAGDLGAEADGGDLAGAEPALRVDRVALDQVVADGVGLLLRQDLGQVVAAERRR